MNEFEEAAIAFFMALKAAGKEKLGHEIFNFTVNISVGTRAEDMAAGKAFGERIQAVLNVANGAIRNPVKVSLQ